MKSRNVMFLIATLLLAHLGCKKSTEPEVDHQQSLVLEAKNYFNKVVLVNALYNPLPEDTLYGNPRITQAKAPQWDNAYTVNLSSREAVVVPIHYNKPFIIKSNFGGGKMYNIDDLTKLLIYRDADKQYHTEVVTVFPDSAYSIKNPRSFSGIASIEEWFGNSINKFQYLPTGIIKKYNNALATQRNGAANRTANQNASSSIIQVCYETYGYNYSPKDPDQGYYWYQSLGCNTYYVEEPVNNTAVNGQDYVTVGGGGGSPTPNSGINTAKIPTVMPPTSTIANFKDYTKCFDNISGSDHSYKVTVSVAQPNPGTRETWVFSDASGSSSAGNIVSVGHTFLVLSETTPSKTIVRNVGFYPKNSVTPYAPSSPGTLNNDESHEYNISLTISLTNSQFTSLLNYISQASSASFLYNLNSNNCTTFALNALSSINITLPHTVGSWLNGSGNDPGDLGEDIRKFPLNSNRSRSTNETAHYNQGTCN